MLKNNFKNIDLGKGTVHLYDFGAVKLHAYKTNDFLSDECFVLQKNNKCVVIESPCFLDNNKEFEQYILDLNCSIEGVLLSYHMAGGTFLEKAKKYANKTADEYGHNGGGKALIDNFTKQFGDNFDSKIHTVTNYITDDNIVLADISMNIIPTSEAFDIEIPEIKTTYTHMLGHDCHSIVAGKDHADHIISTLREYIKKGYNLILSSHYTPEDLKDIETKIEYLEKLKEIAVNCSDIEEFKKIMKKEFSQYSGENYLDMTAGFFFKAQ